MDSDLSRLRCKVCEELPQAGEWDDGICPTCARITELEAQLAEAKELLNTASAWTEGDAKLIPWLERRDTWLNGGK